MLKLLLVDDNIFEREGISFIIKKNKIPVTITEVSDGACALNKLKTENFDILITDIKMPLMDGIELIKQVRDFNSIIEIIIISGYNDFEYAKKLLTSNINNYILKPIIVSEFIETIQRLPAIVNVTNQTKEYSKVINDVLHIIETEYQGDLSLEKLSNRVFLSPNYLSNLFKKELGTGVNKYINDIRLKKASQLLIKSNMKIIDIASYVGIPNISYFNRVFKSKFSSTPSVYRFTRSEK